MKASACLLLGLLASCIVMDCNALTWMDCGAPLSRVITYQDVTVYPQSPDSEQQISVSVQATTIATITNAATNVYITKDGVLYLNVTTRNLCDILATTQASITCPIAPGTYSYNYVYPLPALPQGSYTVNIVSSSLTDGSAIGCLSTTIAITDADQLAGQCTYTSWLTMMLGSTINVESNTESVGSWVQIGPYGTNAGAAAASFPWGSFISYRGTTDIIDTGLDLSSYVWGLNGTLVNTSTLSSGASLQFYAGDFVVGYLAYAGAPISDTEIISAGSFEIYLNVMQSGRIQQQYIQNGSFEISPEYSQPVGFFYPLLFGSLNPFSLSQTANGALSFSGSRQFCTCPIDDCAVCGGDGSSCNATLKAIANPPSSSGLSSFDKAAIGVGVGGGILAILLIAFFAWQLWKRGREQRNVRDDSDLAGPDKPDYGSMAINEVLADHGRPLL